MGFLTFIMNSYSLQFACLKPDSHQGGKLKEGRRRLTTSEYNLALYRDFKNLKLED